MFSGFALLRVAVRSSTGRAADLKILVRLIFLGLIHQVRGGKQEPGEVLQAVRAWHVRRHDEIHRPHEKIVGEIRGSFA